MRVLYQNWSADRASPPARASGGFPPRIAQRAGLPACRAARSPCSGVSRPTPPRQRHARRPIVARARPRASDSPHCTPLVCRLVYHNSAHHFNAHLQNLVCALFITSRTAAFQSDARRTSGTLFRSFCQSSRNFLMPHCSEFQRKRHFTGLRQNDRRLASAANWQPPPGRQRTPKAPCPAASGR